MMHIQYGLISCDSHAQPRPDAFTSRMSARKWGDAIPQLVETSDPKHMVTQYDYPVQRWAVKGQMAGLRGVVNCPTVMGDPLRKTFPQRWEEVPATVYDPTARLGALDSDRVDGEVLFPNEPALGGTFLQGDAEFERECVAAYNDALAEWRQASDRYAPLALIPYLSGIDTAIREMERAVEMGHRGVNIIADPSQMAAGAAQLSDPEWDRFWSACEDLNVPVHWHATGGLRLVPPVWPGYSRNQAQAVIGAFGFSVQAQAIPSLLLSGILERHPTLKWVCAETGLGWVIYVLEACDHEWERRRLWTEGLTTRPSELFHRQVLVDFWYESVGVELRDVIGLANIMWESDFPHSTSTFPDSWTFVDKTMRGVPEEEAARVLYQNALDLYHF
jgi:uncharacterized protein